MKSNTRALQHKVLTYYRTHGRHALPWRKTKNPYRILVSEIMLQQTQVDRVIPKYKAFLKVFPTVQALAAAPLRDVLVLWSGLGYNRRARMLHEAAQKICTVHNGRFPKEVAVLETLPGVGPYTARAVAAFAFNQPVTMIETNIRTVFLHELYAGKDNVDDKTLLPLIEASAQGQDAREWYAALMDYGTHLKKMHPNPSRRSKHHVRQSTFKGSLRESRGSILKLLLTGSRTKQSLQRDAAGTPERVNDALKGLKRDGLVRLNARRWELVT